MSAPERTCAKRHQGCSGEGSLRPLALALALGFALPAGAAAAEAGSDEPEGLRIPILATPENDLEAELQATAPDAEHRPILPERPATYADEAYQAEAERLPEALLDSTWRPAAPERQGVRASGLVVGNPQGHGITNGVWERDEHMRISSFEMPVYAPMFPVPGQEDTTPARTTGMVFDVNPLADAPERLALSATYLQGEATEPDPFDTAPRSAGDATSLALDSALLEGKLQLRGEYAYTRFDPDGAYGAYEAVSDDAYTMQAWYTPEPVPLGDKPLRFSAGVRTQEVGAEYHSLGNQGLWADRRQDALNSNISWGGLSLDTELSRETDNVDADPTRPRIRTESLRTQLNYRPEQTRTREGLFGLFNAPYFQFGYTRRDSGNVGDPQSAPWVVDRAGEELSLSASFSPGPSSWTLAYYNSTSEDRTDVQADSESQTVRLDVRRPLGDAFTLRPNVQYTLREDLDNDVEHTTLQTGVRLDFQLPGDWRGNLSASRSENQASDGWVDNASTRFSANFEHELVKMRPHRPGVNMYLNGSWGEYRDEVHPNGDNDDFQLYLGINLSWPGGA